VDLLSNQLAILLRADRARDLTTPRDLLRPAVRRIAIGDPEGVPAGAYAKTYLESLGLWTQLQPKLIPLPTVRAALAAFETGNTDAAIVYRSDALTSQAGTLVWLVPVGQGPSIVYPAAVIRGPNITAARRFLRFLRGDLARSVFERAGFTVPSVMTPAEQPQS
jgi:molybdate transport system substrate-binding protein